MLAIPPDQDQRYVCKDDRKLPVDEQTIFIVRPLAAQTYYKLQDRLVNVVHGQRGARAKGGTDMVSHVNSGTNEMEILIAGLVGWENFKFPDGREAPAYPTGTDKNAKLKALDMLPHPVRTELSKVIVGDSELDEEDREDLGSLPGSSATGAASPGSVQTESSAHAR